VSAVSETLARKVLAVVDQGLSWGLGDPEPGKMCVEAAVCYAMGLPHSDRPTCVGEAVRAFKIRLNDSRWSSDAARAKGMRKLAIAQLGSDAIDQDAFWRIVVEQTIRQMVPIAFRAAASRLPGNADALNEAATRCERDGDLGAARHACSVARDAAADAYAYAAAAADAAAYAAAAAAADAYADAAADAAAAADADAAADEVLSKAADIGLSALVALGSPGCAYLNLADEAKP
jgi:hypothetical protein